MERKRKEQRTGIERTVVQASPMKQVFYTPRLSQSFYLSSVVTVVPESREGDCG